MPGHGTIVKWSPAPGGKPGGAAVAQYGEQRFEVVIYWHDVNYHFDFIGCCRFGSPVLREDWRRWLLDEIGVAYPLPLLPPEDAR
jgi:hypothetical protein